MVHAIGLALSLFAFWLLLSGYFVPLPLSLGVISTLFVVWIARRMDVIDRESLPLDLTWRILVYWPWLMREIVKANIDVAKIVLSPSLPISPRVIRVPMTQKTDLGRVIFANSITLTPGTVAMEFEGDDIIVHAITDEMAEGLLTGEMDAKVTAVEG